MVDIRNMDMAEIAGLVKNFGEKEYRAVQIFEWVNKKHVSSIDGFKNLPKSLLGKIRLNCNISPLKTVKKYQSSIDNTIKYLFEAGNDAIIESVRMKHDYGNTACISTQAGCNMACKFCASAIGGKLRDLTAGEMLAQVYNIEDDINERVSNIVLMGSGEPLENYGNSIKFIRIINDSHGANISQRHITLSTCGIIDGIYRLAEEKLQITLAVSLHAPNDAIRNRIMPISLKNPYSRLLDACRAYTKSTNRRITFEYALIKGLNDFDSCAIQLAENVRGILCHVNIIPVNEISNGIFVKSGAAVRFSNILRQNGIEFTVRGEKGLDINAACGQLRSKHLAGKENC